MRRKFWQELGHTLLVVWPILSSILLLQLVFGLLITWVERWPLGDGLYFTFVTGLTIGYGDLIPRQPFSRLLAILIGFFGIMLMGLVTAIAIRAVQMTVSPEPPPNSN